jgi:2-keto-3-deoxy-L-rhamnonate aldolase RhmA
VIEKMAKAHERTFLMCQIETEVGLANVDRIAAVKGVGSRLRSDLMGTYNSTSHVSRR